MAGRIDALRHAAGIKPRRFLGPGGQTTLYFYVHLDDGQQMRPDHQEHLGSVSFVVSLVHHSYVGSRGGC